MQRLSLLLVRGEPAPRGGPLTSPRLPPWSRPHRRRRRPASVRPQAQQRAALQGFRRAMAARTCVRLRRETRLQRQARDSHPVADGTWCTGTAQATDADTRHGPTPPRTREVSMSRSSIPAQQPGLTVIVGWDHPLMTFFAQVFDPSIKDDEEACLLWIGTTPEAIPTVAALQAQLTGWATIPVDIVERLTRDRHAATPPTPLQRWAHQLLHGPEETGPDCP